MRGHPNRTARATLGVQCAIIPGGNVVERPVFEFIRHVAGDLLKPMVHHDEPSRLNINHRVADAGQFEERTKLGVRTIRRSQGLKPSQRYSAYLKMKTKLPAANCGLTETAARSFRRRLAASGFGDQAADREAAVDRIARKPRNDVAEELYAKVAHQSHFCWRCEMPPEAEPFIMVVDDSDEDLFLFKRLVHRSGVTLPCQSATGVTMAVTLLEAATQTAQRLPLPVACFTDIKMPGQNGFDLLRWIRGQPALARLPVIMLSSSDDPADLKLAVELGAHCYLTKYPGTATLRAVVNDAMSFPEQPDAFDKPYNRLVAEGARRTQRI